MKNPETSNPSVPPTFKDSKHLQQTQNPYTPSSKFTDAIRISHSHYKPKFTVLSHSHSHYKPKFTQNNNWNLSSSLSLLADWRWAFSLNPLLKRWIHWWWGLWSWVWWVWDRKRLRSAWFGLERCCDWLLAAVWPMTTPRRASDSRVRWWSWIRSVWFRSRQIWRRTASMSQNRYRMI